jgi:hypothetical protein
MTSEDALPRPSSSRVLRALRRALYEAKIAAAANRALALPAARLRRHGVLVTAPGVEVLIEGYPRSANSFAVAAFARAQGWPGSGGGRIAHHTHAPAHVLEAVRRGIPSIVLIRDPADAVLEFLLVKPDLTPRQGLRGYIRFYEPLLPHRSGFVVGPFEEVTTDLGGVIARLNARFGTSFAPFEHTSGHVAAAERDAGAYWASREGQGLPVLGHGGGRHATGSADVLRSAYASQALAGARSRASELFARLTSEPAGQT